MVTHDEFLVKQFDQQSEKLDTVSQQFLSRVNDQQRRITSEVTRMKQEIYRVQSRIAVLHDQINEIKHSLKYVILLLRQSASKGDLKKLEMKVDNWGAHSYITKDGLQEMTLKQQKKNCLNSG